MFKLIVWVMFLASITSKPLEAARPLQVRKLAVPHGGGGSESALVHKELEPPPSPSSCTFIPQKGGRHCH
ncbi:unnamed protein product [Camellia sinensis]